MLRIASAASSRVSLHSTFGRSQRFLRSHAARLDVPRPPAPKPFPLPIEALDAGFEPHPDCAVPRGPLVKRRPLWLPIALMSAAFVATTLYGSAKEEDKKRMSKLEADAKYVQYKQQEKLKQMQQQSPQHQQQQQQQQRQPSSPSQSFTSLPRADASSDGEPPLSSARPLSAETAAANDIRLSQLHSDARSIFQAALDAADPHRMITSALSVQCLSPAFPADSSASDAASSSAAVASADSPVCALSVHIAPGHTRHYDLTHFRRIVVVGAGKAAVPMAAGVEEVLSQAPAGTLADGLVVTKYDHAAAGPRLNKIRVLEAAHPVPDEASVAGAEQVAQLLDKYSSDPRTLIIVLISGGGSSLWTLPEPPLTLRDLQSVNRSLLHSGMPIHSMNHVRKHLDQLKGGGLLRRAGKAPVLSLILSDVIGDDLAVIASGPTVPFERDFEHTRQLLKQYNLLESADPRRQRQRAQTADHNSLPRAVHEYLQDGLQRQQATAAVELIAAAAKGPVLLEREDALGLPITATDAAAAASNVTNVLVGSNIHSLRAAAERARALGYEPAILTDRLDGEARVAAEWLSRAAIPVEDVVTPRAWIAGGETTVTFVPPTGADALGSAGIGGRAQELALAAAVHLHQREAVDSTRGEYRTVLLSGGSDGTDGPTDATGAIVDASTISRAQAIGLDAATSLRRHDSYTFFRALDKAALQQGQPLAHLKPGPTGTNVGDVMLVLQR